MSDTVELKTGDVVEVRGIPGPAMVVENRDLDYASCAWFDKNNVLHRMAFPTVILKRIESSL